MNLVANLFNPMHGEETFSAGRVYGAGDIQSPCTGKTPISMVKIQSHVWEETLAYCSSLPWELIQSLHMRKKLGIFVRFVSRPIRNPLRGLAHTKEYREKNNIQSRNG